MTHIKKLTSVLLSIVMLSTILLSVPTASAAQTYSPQDAMLKVVVNELGYEEGYPDITKYGEWFGAQGVAWCAFFIAWCANETDLRFGTNLYGNYFPRTGTCSNSMQWYQKRNEFKSRSSGYVPKTGDLIYFSWSSGSIPGHIGIVEGTSTKNGETWVDQISGNFGNAVKRYSYKLSDTRIIGYATPNYASQGGNLVDNGQGWVPPSEKDPDEGILSYSGSGSTTDNLNVRKGPATGYSKIGTIPQGTTIELIGKFTNGWYKINYGSGVGYVCGDYVKLNGDIPPTTTSTTTPTTTTTKPTTTNPADNVVPMNAVGQTTENLRVRTGPSIVYSTLTTAPKGTKLPITGIVPGSTDWYQVNYNGISGYSSGDYIQLREDETTTATTTAVTTTTTTQPTTTTTKPTTTTTTTKPTTTTTKPTTTTTKPTTTTTKPTTTTTKPTTTTTKPTTTTTTKPNDGVVAMNAVGQTTENLNVRTGPATTYKILGTAPKGTNLTITGKVPGSPDWYRVNYNGNTAYVCGTYLKISSTPTTTTTTKPTTTTTKPSTTTTTQPNGGNTTGTGVTTANLNMRTGPSTSFARVLVIPTGAQVQITDKTSNGSTTWYKVNYKGSVGYVSGDYLTKVQFGSDNTPAPPSNKTGVTTDYLNVRTGPGTPYSKLGVLNKGTNVTIVSQSNGWCRIEYKGSYAYVSADYIK